MTRANPDDPRKKPVPIQNQISIGIADGFKTVLRDQNAARVEADRAIADAARELRATVAALKQMSVGAGTMMSPRGAGSAARALISGTNPGEFDPGALEPGSRRAPSAGPGGPTAKERRAAERQAEFQQRLATARENADTRIARMDSGEYHAQSMQELTGKTRSDAKDWAYRRLAGRAESWAMGKKAEGAFSDLRNGGALSVLREGFTTDGQGRFHNASGQFVKASDAIQTLEEADPGFVRRTNMASMGMNAAAALRDGQPVGRALMSALPSGALKAAGVAGVAWMAGNKALDFAQGQAAQNREYKNVYGYGDGGAFRDRAGEWVNSNVRGRYSMLGSGEYSKMWDGAVDLGLRGDDRNHYVTTGTSLITDANATGEQARLLMRTAIEAGSSLGGLVDVLKQVGESAKEAGINGNRARDIFQRNYEASSRSLFGATGAKNAALAFTQSQIGLGRSYEGVDYSGTLNRGLTAVAAAEFGYTSSQVARVSEMNPGAMMTWTGDKIRERASNLTTPSGLRFGDAIAAFMRDNPHFTKEYDMGRLRAYLMEQGFHERSAMMLLENMGVSGVTVENALGTLAGYFVGNDPALSWTENEAATVKRWDTGKATEQSLVDAGILSPGATDSASGVEYHSQGAKTGSGGNDLRETFQRSLGTTEGGMKVTLTRNPDGTMRTNSPGRPDLGGTVYPGVQNLIDNAALLGIDDKTKVIVQTPSGPMVVDLDDAIMNYPDQISNGSAQFTNTGVAEGARGKTIAEALNMPLELTQQPTVSDKAMSLSQIMAANPGGYKNMGDISQAALMSQKYGGLNRDFGDGSNTGMSFSSDPMTAEEFAKKEAKDKAEEKKKKEGGGEVAVTIKLAPGLDKLLLKSVNGSPYSPGPVTVDGTAEQLTAGQ